MEEHELLKQINDSNRDFKNKVCLNQNETAKLIGVSSSTLTNYRREGIGPAYRKAGRKILYLKTDIVNWLSQTIKTV